MSRRNRRPQQRKAAVGGGARTSDSFQNFMTRTGIGTGNANDGAQYGFNPVSRNRVQMEFAYRGSWIAGMAVDSVAEDMTRAGVEVHASIDPDDLKALEQYSGRLKIWDKLQETIKWARLYGGAIGVLMIDGQKMETPLRIDTVSKGQFKGILPLDRWVVQPTLQDLVTDFGPEYGKPRFYDVIPDAGGLKKMRIHHSRVIRVDGVELPYWQKIAENGWGQSVLERLWDRMVAFDSTTQGAAQLVYKAHLRTYKVKNLREIIAMGGPAYAALIKQIDLIRAYQSNEGLTLMDSEDEFEAHQYTFSGLDSVLLQFGQQVSGALGIPMVRLFGQSPAGLNSTGESDLRTYYDNIAQQQESQIRDGVERVYRLLHLSKFGTPLPDDAEITFRSLWQMSDEQKATVTNTHTTAVVGAYDAQIIDRATALKELKQLAQITGAFSNITDKQIKEAEEEPAPGAAELGIEGMPGATNEDPDAGRPGAEADPEKPEPDQDKPNRANLRPAA